MGQMTTWRKKTVRPHIVYLNVYITSFFPAISLLFSGEEAYGKYVDLYANHTAFTNLRNIGKRPGYLQYLDLLLLAESGLVHRDLTKEIRFSKDYQSYVGIFVRKNPTAYIVFRYINNLHTYVLSFAKRTMPLVDIDSQQSEATVDFETKWKNGEIVGWEENVPKAQANGKERGGIWCSA